MKTLKVVICLILISRAEAASSRCGDLLESARKDVARLQELTKLNTELDSKFDEYVKADFNSQSEGLLDDLHRNAAIKVAFARKRLNRAIEVQQGKIDTSSSLYCQECKTDRTARKKEFCEVCGTDGDCSKF